MGKDVDVVLLRKLVRLDANTGRLYWLFREPEDFPHLKQPQLDYWNSKFADTEAFRNTNRGGYRYGSLLDRSVTAHRIVWALTHGAWPTDIIDHINRERSDNRPENLRLVSTRQNSQNRSIGVRNKSGHIGIAVRANGKLQVTINNKYVGIFNRLEDAIACRRAAELEHGYINIDGGRP